MTTAHIMRVQFQVRPRDRLSSAEWFDDVEFEDELVRRRRFQFDEDDSGMKAAAERRRQRRQRERKRRLQAA